MGKRCVSGILRLESVEYYATILMYTGYIIERQNTLSSSQVERLLEIRRKLGITTGGIPSCAGVNEADVQGQRRSFDELSESLNLKGVTKLIRPGDIQHERGERLSAPDKSKEEIIGEVVRRVLEQLKQNH